MEQTKKYSDAFCMLYNEFGWNYYPEIVAEQLLNWIRQDKLNIKSVMDLGCGTGVLCEILFAHGMKSAGVDLSEDMIAIAKDRASEKQLDIHYQVSNIVTDRPEGAYDLVTSTGDVLNHIYGLEDVKHIFQNVYACLEPGGFFLFDLLNDAEVIDENPCELDYDEHTHIRLQTVKDHNTHMIEMTIQAWEDGNLTMEEHIKEQIHDPHVICGMLSECGFSEVSCKDHIDPQAAGHGTSLYVCAKK